MEENIRAYVEEIFRDAPNTQEAYELKIELAQNLTDKYLDLCSKGKSPEDAYNLTILGIGDIDALLRELDHRSNIGFFTKNYISPSNADYKKRSAVIIPIAIMLYILSVVPILLFNLINVNVLIGVILMFIMIALATGLLIFNAMTKPGPHQQGDTVVEDFRQWQKDKSKNKVLEKTISSIYWPLVVAFYFLVSFSTGRWGISWIIFLIAPAVFSVIKALLDLKYTK